jgi:exonuclease SbcD
LSESVRYAGAPLHYNFGEGAKPRGSWLVELNADGLQSVDWLDLPVPRRLVTLRGAFADILSEPANEGAEDAWVCVEYTDDLPEADPLRRLQERFPFCARVVHVPAQVRERGAASYVERVRAARTDRELVDAFLIHVREGNGVTDREAELLDDVLDERVRQEALA